MKVWARNVYGRRLGALVALLAPLCAAVPAAAQTAAGPPEPQSADESTVFERGVEVVTVDVVVTDGDGNPIRGLTADDFTVLEEGQAQAITSFEAVELASTVEVQQPQQQSLDEDAAPPRRPPVSTNDAPEGRAARTFLVVFDNAHLTLKTAKQAKGAVAAFLEDGTRPGDRVTLLATAGGNWWTAEIPEGRRDLLALIERLDAERLPDDSTERLTDYEALRITQFQDALVGQRVIRRYDTLGIRIPQDIDDSVERQEFERMMTPGVIDPYISLRAYEAYNQVRARAEVTLAVMERAIEALTAAEGRKSLILVSEGFVNDTTQSYFDHVIRAAQRANVAIYFLNTRGLTSLGTAFDVEVGGTLPGGDLMTALADWTQEAGGAETLAQETGGFTVRNTNDLVRGVRRISDESLAYYLIGYEPRDTPRDGSYRRIEVDVRGKDRRVRARQGYFAPLPDGQQARGRRPGVDQALQEALDAPFERDQIPLRAAAFVLEETVRGTARTLVAVEVDISEVEFRESETSRDATLDIMLIAAHRDSGEHFRHDRQVDLALRPGSGSGPGTWYAFAQDFQLRPGGYQVRVVVRDAKSGRIGSVFHYLDVPELEGLRVSTPILSDRLQQPEGPGSVAPLPIAHRTFTAGGALYCQFDVYGAEKGRASGLPLVSAGYRLVGSDGAVVREADAQPIETTSLGFVSRLLAIGLGDVAPGDYQLLLTVRDEIGDHTAELEEPLSVVAAPVAKAATPETGAGDR